MTTDSPFSYYNYETNTPLIFNHLSFDMGGIDKDDVKNIVNDALSTLKLDKRDDGKYQMTINGQDVGEIELPEDRFLDRIDYDKEKKQLILNVKGSDKPVVFDMTPYIDSYLERIGKIMSNKETEAIDSIEELADNTSALRTVVDKLSEDVEGIQSNLDELASSFEELTADEIWEAAGLTRPE